MMIKLSNLNYIDGRKGHDEIIPVYNVIHSTV